jgi:hypothetical protein
MTHDQVRHQGSAFACIYPSGVGPRLFFQRVPEGMVVKNRMHLDVRVGSGLVGEERLAALEAECARLVAFGAVRVRLLPADGLDESWRDAGHRGQRVLSRLSGREPSRVSSDACLTSLQQAACQESLRLPNHCWAVY